MRRPFLFSASLLSTSLVLCISLFGQRRVSPENLGERMWAVVPMIGTGTMNDPKRPMLAPLPGQKSAITGFSYELSDDGKFALVEFIAKDREALESTIAGAMVNKAPATAFFRKGKHTREEILAEFRKHKAVVKTPALIGGRP